MPALATTYSSSRKEHLTVLCFGAQIAYGSQDSDAHYTDCHQVQRYLHIPEYHHTNSVSQIGSLSSDAWPISLSPMAYLYRVCVGVTHIPLSSPVAADLSLLTSLLTSVASTLY